MTHYTGQPKTTNVQVDMQLCRNKVITKGKKNKRYPWDRKALTSPPLSAAITNLVAASLKYMNFLKQLRKVLNASIQHLFIL